MVTRRTFLFYRLFQTRPKTPPTLHGGLQGVDGVDLCDDDTGAEATQSLDAAFTHVTVTSHHCHLTGNHDVGGSFDAVNQTLPAAVQVVELTLQKDETNSWSKRFFFFFFVIKLLS